MAEEEALVYRVPNGQDPAAVLLALRQEGYEPVREQGPTDVEVVVPCPEGRDRQRARVRAVIRTAGINLEGQGHTPGEVRFADE